jgi:hypothetical protein
VAEDALCDMFIPLIQDYDIEDEEWREDEWCEYWKDTCC